MNLISDAMRRMPFLAGDLTRWPAALYGNRPALVGDTVTTYAQLDARVDELVGVLQARGVRRGERWGVATGEGVAFVHALLAVLRCGAVAAPLPRMDVAQIAAELELDGTILPAQGSDALSRFDIQRLMSSGQPASELPPLIDLDPALILRTSGSGGRPRGVLFPHHAVLANIFANVAAVGYRDDDTTLVVLPLHHAYGLVHQLLCHLAVGATVVLPSRALLPPRLAHDIEHCGATTIATVPPIARFLADSLAVSGALLPRLRLVTIGAARASSSMLASLRRSLPHAQISVTYGLTEAGPRVATHVVGEDQPDPSCVGVPLPNVAIEIRGRGGAGEIVVRSRSVALSLATGESISEGNVLSTGDLGTLDSGELRLLGRGDRAINRGGITVAAEVIEGTLRKHPAVASAVAHAEPDGIWGEVPVATVSLHRTATEGELLRFCAQRLPREECPVKVAIEHAPQATKEMQLLRQFAGYDQ